MKLAFLREALELLGRIPDRILNIEAMVGTICNTLVALRDRPPLAPIPPTYVYVLPPREESGQTMPMMVQSVEFGRDRERVQICFSPYNPMPAGLWIVVVGPGTTRGVKVGNAMQMCMNDPNGQVCRTVDPLPLGVLLVVELEAPARPPSPFATRRSDL